MTLKNTTLTQSDSWVVKQNRYSLIRSNYPSSTYLLDDHVYDSELHLRIPRAFSALENVHSSLRNEFIESIIITLITYYI